MVAADRSVKIICQIQITDFATDNSSQQKICLVQLADKYTHDAGISILPG